MDTSAVRTANSPTSSPNPGSTPSTTAARGSSAQLPDAVVAVPSDVVGHYVAARRQVPLLEGRQAAVTERLEHIDALAELAKTRPAALKALGEIFRSEAGIALEVRSVAGDRLRDLGAVDELMKALDSKNEYVPQMAAQRLGDIGPAAAEAIPKLESLTLSAQFQRVKDAWKGTIGEFVRPDPDGSVEDHGSAIFLKAIDQISGKTSKP